MSNIKLDAYIFFPGNCRDAMEFYKSIFGGELSIQTYASMPSEETKGHEDKIMHAALSGGDVEFMASDSTATKEFGKSAISISLAGTDDAKMRNIFEKLSAKGKVNMPLEEVPWGGVFGDVTDKYGIDWMISIDPVK